MPDVAVRPLSLALASIVAGRALLVLRQQKAPPRDEPGPVESRNTYGLPRGEALRRLLARGFRVQERNLRPHLARLAADLDAPVPLLEPGAPEIARAAIPTLAALWDQGGRQGEVDLDLTDVWDIKDPDVQAAIEGAAFAFADITNATTTLQIDAARDRLRLELSEGLYQQGETLDELRKRVQAVFTQATRHRAATIAQTEASRAVHAGIVASYAQSEVVAGTEWLISSDACPICQKIATEARRVRLGEQFAVIGDHESYASVKHPPLHPRCCLPETPVVAPVGVAGIVAQYDGPVVRLHLSDGSHVAVTPNHMLLTPEGFAIAASLVEGDDLLRYRIGEPVVGGDPDNDGVPTPIHEIVEAWAVAAGMGSARVPVAPEYLHGDAALCKGDIHVVPANGLLGSDLQAAGTEPFGQRPFVRAGDSLPVFVRQGKLASVLFALRDATDGGVGSIRESRALLRAHASHANLAGFRPRSDGDARLDQASPNGGTRVSEGLGDSQFRIPGLVATDNLIGIDREFLGQANRRFSTPDLNSRIDQPVADGVEADIHRLGDGAGGFSGCIATDDLVDIQSLDQGQTETFLAASEWNACVVQPDLDAFAGDTERFCERRDRLSGVIATTDFFDRENIAAFLECRSLRGSHRNPRLDQTRPDGAGVEARRLAEATQRFPGQVTTCKIVRVEFGHYRGPVYDIQTRTSLYLVGPGVVSSNCQCSLTAVLLPEYGGPENPDWADTLDQPDPGPEYTPPTGRRVPEPEPGRKVA
jgi:hypothetical protein